MKRFSAGDASDAVGGKRQKHAAASVAQAGMKEGPREDPKEPPPPYTADDFKADFGRLLRCVDELAEQREKIFKAINTSLTTIAAECLSDLAAGPAAGIIVRDGQPPAADSDVEEQLPDSQLPDSQLADCQSDPELTPPVRKARPQGGIVTLW